jgi:rhodanese-related sulfurtransferase
MSNELPAFRLTAGQARDAIKAGALLVDVRSDLGRGKTGELQGAVIISKDDIEDVMTRRMSAAQKTVVFCGSIKGSEPVVEKLRAAGLKDVYDVDGGFAALSEAGVPVMERKVPQG